MRHLRVSTSDNGDLQTRDSKIRKIVGELTHLTKRAPVAGTTEWQFQWVAPSTTGNNTFWVCGLAVDGNGTLTNDDVNPPCITLNITVGADTKPTAADDTASVNEDSSVNITVTGNDSDSNGTINPATVTIVNNVSHGTTTVNTSTGVVNYRPTSNYHGSDSFTYQVNDNDGERSNTATVSITVNSVNDAPTANNDSATTAEDNTVIINVLSNDSDIDGSLNPAGVTISTAPSHGTTSINSSNGQISYTPASDFNGSDSFGYRVTDNQGTSSNVATVSIAVSSVNDNPIAVNDNATIDEDNQLTVNLLANDSDSDGTLDNGSVTITSPANGNASVTSGVLSYTPNLNFNGRDSLSYTVKDNHGATSNTATVTITVNPVNDPPSANNDSAVTSENTAVVVNLLANDSDIDGTIANNSISIVTIPAHGNVSVNSNNGTATYTPDIQFNGSDSFTYTVKDDQGLTSNSAIVAITVNANQAPVANHDTVTTNEDTPVTIEVLANDSDDIQLDSTTVVISRQPEQGTTQVNSDGTVSYTPQADNHGSDSFSYTVNDSHGLVSNSATVTITINAVNDAPRFTSSPVTSASQDQPYQYPVTVSDGDSQTVTVSLTEGPSWLSVNNNILAGVPPASAVGDHPITLTASDGGANSTVSQTFTLRVAARTDADLTISASLTPSPLVVGQPFNLAYTITNQGPGVASNSVLTAMIYADITIDALDSRCSVTSNTNPITLGCAIDTLAVNQSQPIEITLVANEAGDIATLGQLVYSEETSNDNNHVFDATSVANSYSQTDTASAGADSHFVVSGDINGDGLADAIYINTANDTVYTNSGDGQMTFAADLADGLNGLAGALFDLDNDGDLDLVVANGSGTGPGQANTVYSNTNGVFSLTANLGNGDSRGVTIADFDGDTLADIAFANAAGLNTLYRNNGNNSYTLALAISGQNSVAVTSADMDNDGNIDLIFANSQGSNQVYFNTSSVGQVSFAEPIDLAPLIVPVSQGTNPPLSRAVAVIDANNDNLPDLIFANQIDANGQVLPANPLYINLGQRQFALATTIGTVNTVAVNVADFNDDNFDDLLFINPHGSHQIYQGNGNGSFTLLANGLFNAAAHQASAVDVNNDGRADIIFADNRHKAASVLVNNGSATFNSASVDLTISGSTDVAQAITGDNINLTIAVTRLDQTAFNGVNSQLIVTLPSGFSPTNLPSNCQSSSNQVNCDLANVAAGATISTVIAGTVSSANSGPMVFTATVNSDTSDTNPSNNNFSTTVTIHSAPVANNDVSTVQSGNSVTINVLANDSDDGSLNNASLNISDGPSNGTATIQANGTIAYTATSGFVGTDSFSYQVSDNFARTSNIATVTITVTAVPPTPTTPPPTTTPPSSGGGGGSILWLLLLAATVQLVRTTTAANKALA